MNSQEVAEACTRIFENGSVVRYKHILINPKTIFDLPVIANELDIQRCAFITVNDNSEVWLEEIVKNKKPYVVF